MMKLQTAISELVALRRGRQANAYTEYDEKRKQEFRNAATTYLRAVADALGLKEGEYDLRYNPAGIAVAGDITLHTDTLYVTFSDSFWCLGVLYRSVKGRRDYTGGPNQWMRMKTLADWDAAMRQFKRAAGL
jgi:hypothetical protein